MTGGGRDYSWDRPRHKKKDLEVVYTDRHLI